MKKIFPVVFSMLLITSLFADFQSVYNEEMGFDNGSHYQLNGTRTLRDIPDGGLLLIPDSGADRVMAFDPVTGDLLDLDFIPSDPTNLTTPIAASLHPDGNSILVSDQLSDGLLQYDLDGVFMSWFAPAGGVNTAILDNVRGWSIRTNGNILVTAASGANASAIAEFDPAGNYVGNFINPNTAIMAGPWSILYRPTANDYLISASTTNAIHRFDESGNFLGDLVPSINFPEQICQAANGNILVAAFSTPSACYEYTAGGTPVGSYDVVTGLRGVYELPNGNILVTNGTGVYEISRSNVLVSTKVSGVNARFIHFVEGNGGSTLNPPQNLEVDELGFATWDEPAAGGSGELYFNDFETDNGGLISSDPLTWEWGAFASGPMAGYSGTNGWGTVISGTYNNSSNATLDTPVSYPITSVDAMLEFWHWYNIETSWDGGNVKISADGGSSWDVITPLTGYSGTANTSNPLNGEPIFTGSGQQVWELVQFDLSAYVGQSVMFRWHFGSDSSVTYPGWYIDDVLLTDGNSRAFLGQYNVYLNGTQVATAVTDEFYQYNTATLTAGQSYLAGVTALYDEGESSADTYTFIYQPEPSTFDPPQNVAVNPQTGELSWTPPANTVIFEDFDSYTPGDYLCVVAPALWQTWSNLPGGSEDVQVTDALSLSPSNSILVNLNNDIVLQMDDYTSGVYSFDLDMYVPTGYCGYFNLQKTSTPGTEWAFQVYFQTSGIALVDAGAASATTFPFSHDTWFNSRVVVDLNSDWADFYVNGDLKIGWQWTLGTFGTPGLLQFGGVNIFGGANSTTTDVPMFYVDNVQLQEIVPASDDLTGYNVYLNGSFVTYTTGLSYTYDGLTNGQSYTAGVSAVYDDPGESDIVPVDFVYSPVTTFLPPNNLAATVQNFNDVLLSWDPPGGATEEIYYHSGYDNNGIGTTGVADWVCAARFTADELADYYGGWSITGVNIFLHSMDFSYVGIRVYQGGSFGNPGTLVYDQDITASATALAFTNHLLSTPIPLVAGNEYWIGYEMSATGDHPAAVDAGPAVAGKGDWMYFNSIWQEISVAFALNYNWIINGVLSQGDAVASIGSMKPVSSREVNFKSSGIPEVHHHRTPTKASVSSIDHSRVLSGYKIYRDGVEVGEVTNPAVLSYLDSGLDAGNYEYYVTAIYTAPAGESDPSNLVNANVVLPAPNNPTAVSNFPNILVQWTAPSRNRAVESYNIYQNGTLVTNTTSSFYLHVNVPAGYYVYNIAAVYTGGHEGDWSVDAPVNHGTGNDPNLIPLVTSLEGNYPNPFNPTTIIKFGLSSSETVSLVVYNIRGEKVRTLVNGELEAGYHSIVWDGKEDGGKNSASGVYFYKMRAGTYTSTRKMIMLR